MSLINLEKKVQIVIEKRRMPKPPVTRVGFAIDGSGSMRGLYRSGVVQNVVDRLLAVAAKFDDDGNLDAWMFDGASHPLPQATPADYNGYVQSHILSRYKIDGGTRLYPVMSDICEFYYPEAKKPAAPGFFRRLMGASSDPIPLVASSAPPAFVMAVTDGENDDQASTMGLLQSAQNLPIYWQFIGIGSESFDFIRSAADALPNVGFTAIRDIARVSDEDLFEQVLPQEFIEWVRRFSAPAATR